MQLRVCSQRATYRHWTDARTLEVLNLLATLILSEFLEQGLSQVMIEGQTKRIVLKRRLLVGDLMESSWLAKGIIGPVERQNGKNCS